MNPTLFAHLPSVGIFGLGHALPATMRDNGAGQFEQVDDESPFRQLFTGYGSRRVLGPDESLAELMAAACAVALSDGRCEPDSVDLLTGFASVGEFVAPNELYRVHRILGLSEAAEALPIADEFAAFLSGLRVAAERIWVGSAQTALVACGCRWSSNVDYRDPVAESIGDAAGAALVGALDAGTTGGLRLVGWHSEVPREMYGVMRMTPRKGSQPTTLADPGATTRPLFNMLQESESVFKNWGVRAPPKVATELLETAGVRRQDVTCVAHQASSYLLEEWKRTLAPAHFEDTLNSLGNMTLASIPVTLCLQASSIQTRFVLLLGLGLGVHASACLLERG